MDMTTITRKDADLRMETSLLEQTEQRERAEHGGERVRMLTRRCHEQRSGKANSRESVLVGQFEGNWDSLGRR